MSPSLTATAWGGAGMLLGAGAGVLAVLPFYPRNDDGWATLGWALLAMGVGGVAALVAGAVGIHRGLRRIGDPQAGRTALVFVPTALLLGAATAAIGAFAAPAVARWVVGGFARPAGWGPAARSAGLPQRLVLAVVASLLLGGWALNRFGHELGGHVNGGVMTWAAVLPAVVLPPLVLLRRHVPWTLLAAGVAVAAGLLALAVPAATRNVHPTPERLEQLATDLPVPAGQSVVDVRSWLQADSYWVLPMTVLSTGGPVPSLTSPPAATERGHAAAAEWEAALRDEGWEVTPMDHGGYLYWLSADVRRTLTGRAQHELGPWVRASVLPYGDGAAVVLSTRP